MLLGSGSTAHTSTGTLELLGCRPFQTRGSREVGYDYVVEVVTKPVTKGRGSLT